jgi:hypothetical protein
MHFNTLLSFTSFEFVRNIFTIFLLSSEGVRRAYSRESGRLCNIEQFYGSGSIFKFDDGPGSRIDTDLSELRQADILDFAEDCGNSEVVGDDHGILGFVNNAFDDFPCPLLHFDEGFSIGHLYGTGIRYPFPQKTLLAGHELLKSQSFEIALVHFHQARLDVNGRMMVLVDDPGRALGPDQGTGIDRRDRGDLQGKGKLPGLMHTGIAQVYVAEALNPAFSVPDGFTVPDKNQLHHSAKNPEGPEDPQGI